MVEMNDRVQEILAKPTVTKKELAELLGRSERVVERSMSTNPHFPKPVRLNERVIFWRRSDVARFLGIDL